MLQFSKTKKILVLVVARDSDRGLIEAKGVAHIQLSNPVVAEAEMVECHVGVVLPGSGSGNQK